MPSQSSNLTAIRSTHRARVYVSVMTGNVVLTGTVSANADTVSALNVAYTVGTGSASDVKPGMRVVVTTSGGAYKGTLSVRYAGSITSVNLPIRETSYGDVQIVSGDLLTVYDDFVLSDKIPAADATFSPDHTTYTDQNSDPAPIVTSGGAWAGWLGSGGTVDVEFDGSESYTVDPDSTGSVTHAWACDSGTWDDDTSATPTLTLSAAGSYLVTHTVTDSTNSKTETQYTRVRVHDSSDRPYECTLTSVNGDAVNGWSVAFNVFENATLDDIPDGAPVIVWQEASTGGAYDVANVYGAKIASRSHIVMAGYLRRDTARGSDGLDEIEFEVISPLSRLAELAGFSKVLLYGASPSDWQTIKGLTVKRAIIHLLRNYYNVCSLHDLVFDGFSDASYPAFYVQKSSVVEQVRELADSRDGRVVTDRTGRIEVQRRLELTPLADRSALVLTMTLSGMLDILSYEVSRSHFGTLETYRARGFTSATDAANAAPMFARWPASPARGNQSPTIEKLIVDDMDDLLYRCGMRAAWENYAYYGADNSYSHAPELRLTLGGAYAHLFQFYRETVLVISVDNLRGVDLSISGGFYFAPQSVTVDYADGTATTTLVMRALTHADGAGAVDDTPVSDSIVISDPQITFPPITTAPSDDFLLGSNTYDLGFVADDGYLYLADTRPTNPVWSRYSLVSLGMAGTPVMYIVDAFNFANGVLVTTTNAYRVTNIGTGSRALSNSYAFRYTSFYRSLQSERGVNGFFACVSHQDDQRVDMDYTTDGGVNWSRVTDIGGDWPGTAGDSLYPGCYVSAGTPGKVLFGALLGTGTTSSGRLKVSTDYGATSSDFDSNSYQGIGNDIHCPFQDESIVYHGGGASGVSSHKVFKVVGGVQSDVSPTDGGAPYGMAYTFGIKTCDVDKNSVLLAGWNDFTAKQGVWLSRNGASSWTNLIAPGASVPYAACTFAGDNPNVAWVWGSGGAIAQYRNLNATTPTLKDLSGNLSSFTSPSVGHIFNIFGV